MLQFCRAHKEAVLQEPVQVSEPLHLLYSYILNLWYTHTSQSQAMRIKRLYIMINFLVKILEVNHYHAIDNEVELATYARADSYMISYILSKLVELISGCNT